MDHLPPPGPGGQPHERPNALYSIVNEKTAAGFEALLCSEDAAAASLLEYLSLNRVVLGGGAFCLVIARTAWTENCPFETLLDANACFAGLLEEELIERTLYHMLPARGMVVCCISMLQYTAFVPEVRQKQEKIHACCLAGIEAFHTQTGMEVLVEVSPVSFGTEHLAGTFQRTLDRLQMQVFLGRQDGLHIPQEDMPRRDVLLFAAVERDAAAALACMQRRDYPGFQERIRARLQALAGVQPEALSMFQAEAYRFLDLLCCRLAQSGSLDVQQLARTDLWGLVQHARSLPELENSVLEALDGLTAAGRRLWTAGEQGRVHLAEVQQYMQSRLTDPALTVSALAGHFGMSQPVFSAWFKKYAGVPPLEYLTALRMERAALLLQTTGGTLEQIAAQAGFGSLSSFHRICRARTGMTPAQLRMASALPPDADGG